MKWVLVVFCILDQIESLIGYPLIWALGRFGDPLTQQLADSQEPFYRAIVSLLLIGAGRWVWLRFRITYTKLTGLA